MNNLLLVVNYLFLNICRLFTFVYVNHKFCMILNKKNLEISISVCSGMLP